MTKILSALTAASVLAALAAPAFADEGTTINFEGLANNSPVLDHYSGVHFSPNALSFINQANGGTGAFAGGSAGNQTAIGVSDADPMQVLLDAGFGTSFSVNVAAVTGASIMLTVFDGATMLAQQTFNEFAGTNDCGGISVVCTWRMLTVDLAEGARATSVMITGTQNMAYLDDMFFGVAADGGGDNNVPEPGGLWLGLTALGALALARRFRPRFGPRFSRR